MATHTISKIELPNGDICNIDPAGNGIEETVTITVSDWTGNGPYTYEVTINGITASSVLECYFDDTINYLIDDVTVTPTSNKVTFSTASKPTNTVNATIKAAVTVTGGLPIVTSSDNGKSLVVANGVWSKSSYDGLTTNDVVNNLDSNSTTKPASASTVRVEDLGNEIAVYNNRATIAIKKINRYSDGRIVLYLKGTIATELLSGNKSIFVLSNNVCPDGVCVSGVANVNSIPMFVYSEAGTYKFLNINHNGLSANTPFSLSCEWFTA